MSVRNGGATTVTQPRRVLLTVRNVPTLRAEGGRETIWRDATTPGFYLAVSPPSSRYPKGVRAYGVWYRVRGRARQKRLGRHPIVGLAAARARARAILEAARVRRVDIGAMPTASTLADVVDVYIASARKAHPRTTSDRTLAGYEQMLEADIRHSRAGRTAIEDLHRRDLVDLFTAISGRAPTVARRVRQLLVAACRWALREEIIESDPTSSLDKAGAEPSRERVLRDDEIAILWRACAEEAAAKTSAAIERGRGRNGAKWTRERTEDELEAAAQRAALARILLLTAQRSGETAMMEWPEIAADWKLWHIPAEHRKGQRGKRSAHVVPLSEAARSELRGLSSFSTSSEVVKLERSPRAGRVFPWALANHRHWIDPLRDRAHSLGLVDHWTPHDLRRTAASGMARLGFTRSVIALVLGHTMQEGGATTGVYDRFDRLPERVAALEKWGAHVAALVSGSGVAG